VNIIALDSDGNAKSQKRTIRDYIVCEIELDGKDISIHLVTGLLSLAIILQI